MLECFFRLVDVDYNIYNEFEPKDDKQESANNSKRKITNDYTDPYKYPQQDNNSNLDPNLNHNLDPNLNHNLDPNPNHDHDSRVRNNPHEDGNQNVNDYVQLTGAGGERKGTHFF